MFQVATPTEFDSHTLAEYMEAVLLVEKIDRLTAAETLQRFPLGQRPSSVDIEYALAVISARQNSFGEAYPYTVEDGEAASRTSDGSLYDFLLIMSLEETPVRRNRDFKRSDPLFDEIVATAFRNYLGGAAQSIIFGWPPREGRPAEFGEAVSWASSMIGVPDGILDRPANWKDAGVDIIAWKPFADGRSGFAVYLVQNTVQLAYSSKPKDVVPSQWLQWIRFGTAPLVGFAVPFSIPLGDEKWLEINLTADVPFDRSRILEFASSLDPELDSRLRSFNRQQVNEIRTFVPETVRQETRVRKPGRRSRSIYRDERSR